MNKNVPNILTITRIVFTPILVLFFLLPIKNGIGIYVALGIYIVGCFTDLLDGKIARKYNLVSDFGKFMDQIADKVITTTAMILVLFRGVTFEWLAILMLLVVIIRDILISGIRMVAANKNIVIAADKIGKWKSLFLDVSSMILMFYLALKTTLDNTFVSVTRYVGLGLMGVGVLLTIISCINYSRKALIALKNQKSQTQIENK